MAHLTPVGQKEKSYLLKDVIIKLGYKALTQPRVGSLLVSQGRRKGKEQRKDGTKEKEGKGRNKGRKRKEGLKKRRRRKEGRKDGQTDTWTRILITLLCK